ncbi:alpha/beta hydrolase [Desulfoluna butyratoxydans]|uniref:Alpha/beta hydrolase fold n=1 Tax=Desulfoluna butyratoxydans TaxID=231438 RepID=A0A4U8YSZ2_9BACT|nr:alpha/beta fold hydrolase [Desulfoluna butyratoxydans]VFQ46637.1 alpha/beta hydrolase fold [Desulfoluna butyratoxydans]
MTEPSPFDRLEFLSLLFHPRPGLPVLEESDRCFDLFIPSHDGERLAVRCHLTDKALPTLLFFHGNGEVASDYDEAASHLTGCGFNLIIAEYRGYGLSRGEPSVTHMLADARKTFAFVSPWLSKKGYTGPMVAMGRSLGSAPAIDLAAAFPDKVRALVIESGFARLGPLLRTIGLPHWVELPDESEGPANLAKISTYPGPLLIIHAHEDSIIPFHEGEDLFAASPSTEKQFLGIRHAGHNDIFYVGFRDYLESLARLSRRLMS